MGRATNVLTGEKVDDSAANPAILSAPRGAGGGTQLMLDLILTIAHHIFVFALVAMLAEIGRAHV